MIPTHEETPLGRPAPWPAPGKLNLFLHVVGRRADGYHELQTAFQFIDLCDSLQFFKRPSGVIERLGEVPTVAPEADLTVRAARLLATHARASGLDPLGRLPGVAIAVDKRLPMQGGVGGGSSDAATTLVALNWLWGLGFGPHALSTARPAIGRRRPGFRPWPRLLGRGGG